MEDSLTTHEEFKRLRAENARLEAAVEDLEDVEAQSEQRGEALEAIRQRASRGPSFLHPTKKFAADVVRLAEPAIAISPEEAREKERQ